MILLDRRVGSAELMPYFGPYDVEVVEGELEFGDMAWWGEHDNKPLVIGVERKVIGDLINSMRSNRLSGHQLPGLLTTYDVVYLLVEGVWRPSKEGVIEVPVKGGWRPMIQNVLYREVEHYLATLEHECGVNVIYTDSRYETAAWAVSRYKWWQKKKHDAHKAIYVAPVEADNKRFRFSKAGPVETFASILPGVSKKAYGFGKVFRTIEEVVGADVKKLQEVEGVGAKGAKRIWEWVRGK